VLLNKTKSPPPLAEEKKQDETPPGSGSPFDTFRQNSTHIAMDETGVYLAKINELEQALRQEKGRKTASYAFQTPAPPSGRLSPATPDSVSGGRDPESLWMRNQTLVKEVRFAEQTCVELSGQTTALEQQIADLQAQLERDRQEHHDLREEMTELGRGKATAESLEDSWKARVTEVENLLTSAETEKARALQRGDEWEHCCRDMERQASEAAEERQGQIMQALLDKEELTKRLAQSRQGLRQAQDQVASLEQAVATRGESSGTHAAKLEGDLQEARAGNEQLQRELEASLAQAEDASRLGHVERARLTEQVQALQEKVHGQDVELQTTWQERGNLVVELTKVREQMRVLSESQQEERNGHAKQVSGLQQEVDSLREALEEEKSWRDKSKALEQTEYVEEESRSKKNTAADSLALDSQSAGSSSSTSESGVQESPTGSCQMNATIAPNSHHSLDLEFMEEARGREQQNEDESTRDTVCQIEVGDTDVQSVMSDSLSSIAGLSHLPSDSLVHASETRLSVNLQADPTLPKPDKDSEENDHFEVQKTELQDEIKVLKSTLKEAQLERNLLKASMIQALNGGKNQHFHFEKSESDRRQLENQLEDAEGELDKASDANARQSSLCDSHIEAKNSLEKLAEGMKQELLTKRQTVEALTQELELANNGDDSQDRSGRTDRELTELRTAFLAASEGHKKLSEDLKRIKSEHFQLLQRSNDLEKANMNLKSHLKDYSSLSHEFDALSADKARAEADLLSSTSKTAEIQKQMNELRRRNKETTNALQEANQAMKSTEIEVEATRLRLAEVDAHGKLNNKQDDDDAARLAAINGQLRSRIDQVEEERDITSSKLAQYVAEADSLRQKLHSLQSRVEALSSLESENAGLSESVDTASREIERLQVANRDCTETISRLGEDLDVTRETVRVHEERRRDAELLVETTDERLLQMQCGQVVLSSANDELRSEVKSNDEAIQSLENDVKARTGELEQTRTTIDELKHKVDETQEKLDQAENRVNKLLPACELLESQKEDLLSQCASLRSTLNYAEVAVAETEKENLQMQSEVSRLNHEIDAVGKAMNSCREATEAAEALATDTEKRYLKQQNDVSAMTGERVFLQREVDSYQRLLSQAETKLGNISAQLEKSQEEKCEAEQSAQNYKEDLIASEEAAKDAEARITSARNEIGTLVSQRDFLKDELRELNGVRAKLEKSKLASTEKQREIAAYRERLAESEGRLKAAVENQDKLQNELRRLKGERNTFQSDCEKLRAESAEVQEKFQRDRYALNSQLEETEEALRSAETTLVGMSELQTLLQQSEERMASLYEVEDDFALAQEDLSMKDNAIETLKQKLGESVEATSGLHARLSEVRETITQKEQEAAQYEATISLLQEKCKGLRQYSRTVAGKCDAWEVYYEKHNGVVEGLKRSNERMKKKALALAGAFPEQVSLKTTCLSA
jgi:chromosome segregation ATPase